MSVFERVVVALVTLLLGLVALRLVDVIDRSSYLGDRNEIRNSKSAKST